LYSVKTGCEDWAFVVTEKMVPRANAMVHAADIKAFTEAPVLRMA
jgi:hypothetical protein